MTSSHDEPCKSGISEEGDLPVDPVIEYYKQKVDRAAPERV